MLTKKRKIAIRMSCTALFTAFIALCAFVSLSFGDIRFSLQLLAVLLAAGLLPFADAMIAVVLYILLGALGVPIFAGFNGGLSVLLGPTGGFIIGFIFTVLLSGMLLRAQTTLPVWKLFLIFTAGTAACYLCGCLHFYIYMPEKGIPYAISVCVFPYLLPDGAKIFLASLLVKRVRPFSQKFFGIGGG